MKRDNKYLLDADTFMTAHRQHYRFSFCPAYWKAILLHHGSDSVASIVQVRKELLRGKDALSGWVADDVPGSFFKETTDAKVLQTYSTIAKWVVSQPHLAPAAQAKFASGADGWLVQRIVGRHRFASNANGDGHWCSPDQTHDVI